MEAFLQAYQAWIIAGVVVLVLLLLVANYRKVPPQYRACHFRRHSPQV